MDRFIIAAAIATAALAGCQSTAEPVAPLSPTVQRGLDEYMTILDPGAFFVTPDGQFGGGSYCPGMGEQCMGSLMTLARRTCERNSGGRPCVLYAHGRRIVAETREAVDPVSAAGGTTSTPTDKDK